MRPTRSAEVIADQLAARLGSLVPGHRHPVLLEQVVFDGVSRWVGGPHPVGWVERTPTGLRVRLVATQAGRTARALLEDGLLGAVLSGDYPPTVRLTDQREVSR